MYYQTLSVWWWVSERYITGARRAQSKSSGNAFLTRWKMNCVWANFSNFNMLLSKYEEKASLTQTQARAGKAPWRGPGDRRGDNSARETLSHHQAVIFSRTKKAPDLLFLSLLFCKKFNFLESSPWRSPGFTVVWSFSLGRTGQLGRQKGKGELHRWAFLVPLQRRDCNHASVSRKWPLLLKIGQRMRKSAIEIYSIEIKQERGEQAYYLERNTPYNYPLAVSKSNIFRAPGLRPQLRNWKKGEKKVFHIFLMLSCLRTF